MQVNTRAGHEAQVERMAGLQQQIDTLQGQISTGSRIDAPSDDPVGNSIALRLRRAQDSGRALGLALDGASSRLGSTDIALGSIAEILQRAREIGLTAANSTINAADRATLGRETVQLGEQLLALANRRDAGGVPLFGGALGQGDAFVRSAPTASGPGKVAWAGVGGAAVLAVGGSTVVAGFDGPSAFTGPDADAFALLDDLGTALAAPDATRAGALALSLTGLEAAVGRVADARAVVGTRQVRLDAESVQLKDDWLALEKDVARVAGLDLPSAISRVQRLMVVLQATQASFVKVNSLSLWDRL
ncbi:hypothetical protein [Glacieibacterium sp.]|uniref:flagellin N-terminal helical domain-containing protein n=1 Tax=Glacieibacterium sp. TaxID=2860237 RepID=UPI003B00AF55